jgi:hypothetical protein
MAAKLGNDRKMPINASRSLQRKGIVTVLFLMLALATSESFAEDDDKFYTECTISRGDSVDKVKQFYRVPVDPQEMALPIPFSRYQYHLEQYGIWVFFDELKRVSGLRFDAPFRGRIGGIVIGDTADRLRSLRGEPIRQFRGLPDFTQQKKREQQAVAMLEALPDPVPKSELLAKLVEIGRMLGDPIKFNTAWVYDPNEPSFARYDIGPDDNRVQSIFVNSCSPGS